MKIFYQNLWDTAKVEFRGFNCLYGKRKSDNELRIGLKLEDKSKEGREKELIKIRS